MPLNTPIAFILTVTWGDELALSLVYSVSFAARVVVRLAPESTVVAKDSMMLVHSAVSDVINFDGVRTQD